MLDVINILNNVSCDRVFLVQDEKSAACFLLHSQKFIELVRVYVFFPV
jgi:hypothetical protein